MANLTVVIISLDEEERIEQTLDSVCFADEIIIVDGISTDRTVEIARKYTDKIIERKFENFSFQRNFALSMATNKWVFVIDCDEIVTPELRAEIEDVVASDAEPDTAYLIGRDNIFMDKRLKFSGVRNDKVIRLFPNNIRYKITRVHEIPEIGHMKVKRLEGRIQHMTYKSYGSMLQKIDHYSTLKALDMFEAGYNPTYFKMIFKPMFRFFRHFIIQCGFLDGKRGFIIAYIRALEVFQRLTKVWRMNQGEDIR